MTGGIRPCCNGRIFAMTKAGFLGITANTVVLKAAPFMHIYPGAGGLLQLILLYTHRFAPSLLPALETVGLTNPPSTAGFLWFHFATGLGMIFLYFYLFFPRLPRPNWWSATLFSLFPWLLNSVVVLPLLGQGFAGLRVLRWSGALYFFFANWLFVYVSSISYTGSIRGTCVEIHKSL